MNRKERRTAAARGRQRARREQRKDERQVRQLKRRIEDAIMSAIAPPPSLEERALIGEPSE